jgi:hypothetical protein
LPIREFSRRLDLQPGPMTVAQKMFIIGDQDYSLRLPPRLTQTVKTQLTVR